MPESRGMWIAKTLGLIVLAAVATSLLTTWLQHLLWDQSNPGISGGASAAVAVAVAMSRRRTFPGTSSQS